MKKSNNHFMIHNKKQLLTSFIFIFIILSCTLSVMAHPGRLDGNGGHWDRQNGTYHYHDGTSSHTSSNNNSSNNNNIFSNNYSPNYSNNSPSSNNKSTTIRESITITNKPTELFVGDEIKLNAELQLPSGADRTIDWLTDDSDIATIDGKGVLKTYRAGKVVITAKRLDTEDRFEITVQPYYSKIVEIPLPNETVLVAKIWEVTAAIIIISLLIIILVVYLLNRTNRCVSEYELRTYLSNYLDETEIRERIQCLLENQTGNRMYHTALYADARIKYQECFNEIIEEYKKKLPLVKEDHYRFSYMEMEYPISKVLRKYIGKTEDRIPPHWPKIYNFFKEKVIFEFIFSAIILIIAFTITISELELMHEYKDTAIYNTSLYCLMGAPLISYIFYKLISKRTSSIYTTGKRRLYWLLTLGTYGAVFLLSHIFLPA